MSIDRLKQTVVTGFSTDKKKVLLGGFSEALISVFEEMEQMVNHIETLERKVNDLEKEIKTLK